jgi:hypothetical protein
VRNGKLPVSEDAVKWYFTFEHPAYDAIIYDGRTERALPDTRYRSSEHLSYESMVAQIPLTQKAPQFTLLVSPSNLISINYFRNWVAKYGLPAYPLLKKRFERHSMTAKNPDLSESWVLRSKAFAKIFRLSALQLGLHVSNTDLRNYTALSGSLNIGPFTAKIDTTGLQALWTFPNQQAQPPQSGSFDFDFKPPRGVGFKVDAKTVKGGGFLFFDSAKGEYAGVADLNFNKKVGFKAVGIITTQMPDGSSGFSFLLMVSISGAFKPLPLGFGFTLNDVGGLIGLNRSMDVSAIQLGERDKTLDAILFPENPLKNAKRIIASAGTVFFRSR